MISYKDSNAVSSPQLIYRPQEKCLHVQNIEQNIDCIPGINHMSRQALRSLKKTDISHVRLKIKFG